MTVITATPEQIPAIVAEGLRLANVATVEFLEKHGDRDACGFAWCTVNGVRSNTKLGMALQRAGFRKAYTGGLQFWGPDRTGTQSINAKEEGAMAMASYLRTFGLEAFAGSRLD